MPKIQNLDEAAAAILDAQQAKRGWKYAGMAQKPGLAISRIMMIVWMSVRCRALLITSQKNWC